jgi:hypothetical protein
MIRHGAPGRTPAVRVPGGRVSDVQRANATVAQREILE